MCKPDPLIGLGVFCAQVHDETNWSRNIPLLAEEGNVSAIYVSF
jgi:hypothetical protein